MTAFDPALKAKAEAAQVFSPGPWRLERDRTIEVLSARGESVAKVPLQRDLTGSYLVAVDPAIILAHFAEHEATVTALEQALAELQATVRKLNADSAADFWARLGKINDRAESAEQSADALRRRVEKLEGLLRVARNAVVAWSVDQLGPGTALANVKEFDAALAEAEKTGGG